jgi:hypothetical protein
MTEYPYIVNPQEPAILVELYLPKKAAFQGVLYNTLTSGFSLEEVKRHFLSADESQQRKIRSLLGKGWSILDYDREEISGFRRVFFGYSLYDVDGVFLKSVSASHLHGDQADDAYRIVEETSQVIRMVFKYPCASESFTALSFLKLALERPRVEGAGFAESQQSEIQRLAGPEAEHILELLSDLQQWVRYVGLFVFGYLVYHICERILELGEASPLQTDPADLLQDEIWVTSTWNLNMNVVDWVSRGSSATR